MTLARYQKIMRVLRHRQPDLSLLAEDVYKPHNLSAMLRTCDAVGVGKVHAVTPTGGLPTYNDTSASADKWVEVRVYDRLEPALEQLRQQNMQLLATTLSAKAVDYRQIDYTKPSCVIFGNEKNGVSEQAMAAADAHIIVPMVGMVQSLNVSVATAVIMFEAQRQRMLAGFYDSPQMDMRSMEVQAYQWLYPRQAALLTEQGAPFPHLDATGQVVATSEPIS